MTITESFARFIEKQGYGTLGQNIYLFRVPNSLKTETDLLWIIPSGGTPVNRNKTGEIIKSYQMLIYFRSNSAERVDKALNALEETLNCAKCVKLDGFELVDIRATQLPTDQDIDSENRMVGSINCQIQVYKSCD